MPQPTHIPGTQADVVPPMPLPSHPNQPVYQTVPPEELNALANDAQSLRESARRIENAARSIAAVSNSTTIKLSRKEKVVVGATALGLVGVGVGGTLLVQSIRRGRAARRSAPMVAVTTK